MPEIQYLVDIEDWKKMPSVQRPNINSPAYALDARCPFCDKWMCPDDDHSKFLFGIARLKDGTQWYESKRPYTLNGGYLEKESKGMNWLFRQESLWDREDCVFACSEECWRNQRSNFEANRATEDKDGKPQKKTNCDHCGAENADKRCGKCKNQWRTHASLCNQPPTPTLSAAATPASAPTPASTSTKTSAGAKKEGLLKCSGCDAMLPGSMYSNSMLRKKGKRKCGNCVAANAGNA